MRHGSSSPSKSSQQIQAITSKQVTPGVSPGQSVACRCAHACQLHRYALVAWLLGAIFWVNPSISQVYPKAVASCGQRQRVAEHAGIAGVYDIETHYQYEYGRGVAELSTMKRAMGGRHMFPTQSPALILNSACGGKARVKLPGIAEAPVTSRYEFCLPFTLPFAACFDPTASCSRQ